MGFRNPATATEVITGAGSQVTTAGAVGWNDAALFDYVLQMGPYTSPWFYCGARAGLMVSMYIQGVVGPPGQRTRVQLEWTNDPLSGSVPEGQRMAWDLRAATVGDSFVLSRGTYVRLVILQNPAAHFFSVRAVPTDRPHPPGAYLRAGMPTLLDTGNVAIGGGGVATGDLLPVTWTGPVKATFYTGPGAATGAMLFTVLGADYLGGAFRVGMYANQQPGVDAHITELFLPPCSCTYAVQNLGAGASSFLVAILPGVAG